MRGDNRRLGRTGNEEGKRRERGETEKKKRGEKFERKRGGDWKMKRCKERESRGRERKMEKRGKGG